MTKDKIQNALEEYSRNYLDVIHGMTAEEIAEEFSFVSAIKDAVSDKTDYQSVVSRCVDSMYELCHNEVICRVLNNSGTLAPYE